jgi:Glycosyltransferase 61
MAHPYREVAARIVGDAKPSEQPVYLSRRLLPSSQRLIIGESDLEDALRHNGFRIAYPETMTFEDQVRLINGHADIFSNAGSAAQNVLFALHAPRLHLLTNGHRFSPDYFMHASLVGAPTSFINCLGTAGRKSFPGEHKLTPHLVDVPALLNYLERQGFLTRRVSLSACDRDPGLLAQYDETWLYGRVRTVRDRRETLPSEIEREALDVAPSSWPVSLGLARYYTSRDIARAKSLVQQFATLVAAERDPVRLARYRADVEDLLQAVTRRCGPETAGLVTDVLAQRFNG